MRTTLAFLVGLTLLPFLCSPAPAQEGAAERIGERIGEGLDVLSQQVQQAWRDVRRTVDGLGVQGRVYGRLRWDKALANAQLDVDVEQQDIVTLTGQVANREARDTALRLARDTVGVRQVVDHLQVAPRPAEPSIPAPTANQ